MHISFLVCKFSVSALKKTENNVEAALSDEEGRAVDFENDTEHAKLEDKEYRVSHSAVEKPISVKNSAKRYVI